MASDMCVRRLTKELKALKKEPQTNPKITVAPNETNILEMHYVIEGTTDTPYDGGIYLGKLLFPKEYPLKPPAIIMLTPNGRFHPNRRLCLSMSSFHEESWCPLWSTSTVLTGMYSFMVESTSTLGSIETSDRTKRQLATASLEWNVKNDPMFCKLFPEYVERYEAEVKERLENGGAASGNMIGAFGRERLNSPSLATILAGLLALFSFVMAFLFL
ncbi:hypothetical protein MPSEU_000440900 [Mayamaea pseudoterrestris]|nr:hypothetical protein MPSEU_000440900 [Mayamaea pseudoterrestris]